MCVKIIQTASMGRRQYFDFREVLSRVGPLVLCDPVTTLAVATL